MKRKRLAAIIIISWISACNDSGGGSSESQVAAVSPDAPAKNLNHLPLTYESAKPILDKACGVCHGPTPQGGAPAGVDLTRWESVHGVAGVEDSLARLIATIRDEQSMPPSSSYWTAAERDFIIRWLEVQMP